MSGTLHYQESCLKTKQENIACINFYTIQSYTLSQKPTIRDQMTVVTPKKIMDLEETSYSGELEVKKPPHMEVKKAPG